MATRGTIELPPGFDVKYVARTKDPYNKLYRSQQDRRASAIAIMKVAEVMMDGVPRIDEEIWSICWHNGYEKSQDTIEHARLAMSDVGLLLFTGNLRKTQFKKGGREWIWSGAEGTDALHEAFVKGYNPLGPND